MVREVGGVKPPKRLYLGRKGVMRRRRTWRRWRIGLVMTIMMTMMMVIMILVRVIDSNFNSNCSSNSDFSSNVNYHTDILTLILKIKPSIIQFNTI